MSTIAMRALKQVSEAVDAFRKHRAAQDAAEVVAMRRDCEFEHPHPSHPCGKRITEVSPSRARDRVDQAFFFSGWDAALEEVLFVAERQSPEEAIRWAREHLEFRTERGTTK